MARVEQFEKKYNAIEPSKQKDFYLQQRQAFNSRDEKGDFLGRQGIEGAALFVFLNKAGFNGMYRENVAGDFNIPFGKREKLNLAEDRNLRLASSALRALTVLNQDYKLTVADAVPGDLVYFDPPYAPLSKTSSFEGYNSSNLGGFDQEELRDVFINLTERNVHCLVSNSSAPLIEDLYKGFNLVPLTASRAISASADGRKKVKEYLIDNFEQVQG
jgi:DNA adenine methylase